MELDWFKIGKGLYQGCILTSYLFNLYVEYIMWNASLGKAKAEIKIFGRNVNNLRNANDTTLNGRKPKGTKEPLEGEEGEWKSWLKTKY